MATCTQQCASVVWYEVRMWGSNIMGSYLSLDLTGRDVYTMQCPVCVCGGHCSIHSSVKVSMGHVISDLLFQSVSHDKSLDFSHVGNL